MALIVGNHLLKFSCRNSKTFNFTEGKKSITFVFTRCASSGLPEMPPCDVKPKPYKGMPGEHLQQIRKDNINPGIFTYYKKPILIHQGHMQWLWDSEGRRYLDMFAGIVTVSVGHCHPKVVRRAEEQMEKLWHTTNIYLHPTIHEYAQKLTSKLPGNLKVCYFTNSGSEANDLALLMARMYTGTYDVVSLRNCYHGGSPYLMGLTALSTWRYNVPSGFGMHQTINPDPFRGPWGGSRCRDSPIQPLRKCDCKEGQCNAGNKYVEQLEDVLRFSMPKGRVGAFFVESIQGNGGALQFPKNFIKNAFEKVREHGGVCVADEVQTGFGRTGTHFWGFEGHGVIPDIVTMAKGIGNGFPMAAVVTTPEIAACMGRALHFNTYGGNPLACAVGSAVLDVIEEEKTQQNSHDVGNFLLTELAKLRDEFDIVGDVRGKGLMIGVEMVNTKKTNEPLALEISNQIMEDIRAMGVLVGKGGIYGHVFRIKPCMNITKADAEFFVAVFRKALENATN